MNVITRTLNADGWTYSYTIRTESGSLVGTASGMHEAIKVAGYPCRKDFHDLPEGDEEEKAPEKPPARTKEQIKRQRWERQLPGDVRDRLEELRGAVLVSPDEESARRRLGELRSLLRLDEPIAATPGTELDSGTARGYKPGIPDIEINIQASPLPIRPDRRILDDDRTRADLLNFLRSCGFDGIKVVSDGRGSLLVRVPYQLDMKRAEDLRMALEDWSRIEPIQREVIRGFQPWIPETLASLQPDPFPSLGGLREFLGRYFQAWEFTLDELQEERALELQLPEGFRPIPEGVKPSGISSP